jgi:phenylacetate-CoA ligase
MNRSSLLKLQNSRLRNIVDFAYHKVPFYRELYQNAGLKAGDVTDVKAIWKLPTVNKDQLRAVSLENRTASGTDVSACRVHTTSGSTGTTLTLLEDEYSFAFRDALNLRFLWAYGVRPLDRVVRMRSSQAGGAQPIVRLGDRRGLWSYVRKEFARQLTYDTDLKEHLRLFSKWKPDVLMAQTSYCHALAEFSELTGNTLSFRIVVTAGGILDDSTRKLISDRFGAEVYDHYGCEEVGGSIAWECPSHSGYHIDAETLLVEFLRRGEAVLDGPGEVHVTSFCRVATPIIRYFNGDIATPIDDECPCGRGLPLIGGIQGRIVDFILTEDGQHVSPIAVIHALQNVPGVDRFKVTQSRDFSIEILVVCHGDDAKSVTGNVRSRCQTLFRELPFEIKLVDRIEDSNAPKFRVVESRLAH